MTEEQAARAKASPKTKKSGRLTPMMVQYLGLKAEHPDAVLLFRMGDFYETFYDDAKLVSSILGLTLTAREKQGDNPIPLAGVPYHAIEQYLARLLDAGCTVAICEQVEDPAQAKGLVKREVVEVISPGTITNPALIRSADGVFLLTVRPGAEGRWGWSLLDGSTGEFRCGSASAEEVQSLPRRFGVAELVLSDEHDEKAGDRIATTMQLESWTPLSSMHFDVKIASEELCTHFGLHSLSGLGLGDDDLAVGAAGAALRYLSDRQRSRPTQVLELHVDRDDDRMHLDRETVAHLELFTGIRDADPRTSLFHHIDRTATSIGRRRLGSWLRAPLVDADAIAVRHDALEWLLDHSARLAGLRETLRGIADLERIAGRIATGRVLPHEVANLRDGLSRWPLLADHVAEADAPLLCELGASAPGIQPVTEELLRALVAEPPTHLRQGRIFAAEYDTELDRLRELDRGGKAWIASYQEAERERTGISGLKVGYNKVFGYYVEVTNKHLDRVPEDYLEKQRLAGGKRFVTEALKQREQEILRAQDDRVAREAELFGALVEKLQQYLTPLRKALVALGNLDACASLAELARASRYTRPALIDDDSLEIIAGRHPVVEQLSDEAFIPNDLVLDRRARQIVLLTGPNMGGKSTYLRQAALIVILAQMGSFVPAESARIGIVDRVFTRVGASDDLARGQSTFLVEMTETARILRGATERSLVIFDEVGRGTSTQDGLALARAITEYLHDGPAKPRTLFATHFHELTTVADSLERGVNARLEVREWEGKILFLHKVAAGASDRSYGVHVAELAGVPRPVLERARELLESTPEILPLPSVQPLSPSQPQMGLFSDQQLETPLRDRLRDIAVDQLKPVEALVLLAELVEAAREDT